MAKHFTADLHSTWYHKSSGNSVVGGERGRVHQRPTDIDRIRESTIPVILWVIAT